MALARGIRGRGPGALVEGVRRKETRGRRQCRAVGGAREAAQVAGRVGRAHVVPVGRPRGEASAVAIRGGGGGRDLGEPGRAPRARAALHQIVLDRDVVVRGGPGEVDLTRRGTAGGEPSGHTRRLGIRRQRRTAHGARIGAHVAGRIGRTHAVPEGRPRGEADVAETRGGGGPDLEDAAGAPRIRAVIHQIVLDRDVVVRGGPGHVDLTRRGTGGAEPGGHTRRLRIGRRRAAEPDYRRDRWDAVGVDDEEHVVTRRSDVRVPGGLDGQAAGGGLKCQGDEALVHVERVRYGPQSDQRSGSDPRRVRRGHEEPSAVVDGARRRGDRRPRPIEEVGGRVDLGAELVHFLRSVPTAPRDEDAAVRKQQRGGVVHPGCLHGCQRCPCLRGR